MEHNTNTTTQTTQNCHLHFAELHNRVGYGERDLNDTQTIMNSMCERNICNNVESTLSDDVMTLPYKINHMQNTNHTKPLDPSIDEIIRNSNASNVHYEREQLEEERLHEENNPQCYKGQQEQLERCNDNKNNPSNPDNNVVNETICTMESNRVMHTEPRVHCDAEEIHLYSPPSDHRLPNTSNNNINNKYNRESMNNNNRETDYKYEQYYNNNIHSNYNNNYYYNEMQDNIEDDVHTERVYVTRSHMNDNYINNNEEMKTMKVQLPTISNQPTCTHTNTNYYSNNLLSQPPPQQHSASSPFKHVAVFVNPGSGNTDVAKYIKRSLSRILLPEQVMLLNKNVFAHPEVIRHVMRKYAVIYHNKEERQDHTNMTNTCSHYNQMNTNYNNNDVPCANNIRNVNQNECKEMHQKSKQCDSVRGTVLVAGGDGTVSFIMSQLDILRSELEESSQKEHHHHIQEQEQKERPPNIDNNYHANSEETIQNKQFTHEQLTLSNEGYTKRSNNNRAREQQEEGEETRRDDYINNHYENELEEDDTSDTCSEHSSSSGNSENIRSEFLQQEENHHHKAHRHNKHKWYTLPALAPLPLGTGNDFSNSVGFGHGFNRSVARQFFGGCCQGCLGWCKRKNKQNENDEEEEEELQYSYNWSSSCHNNTNTTNRNNDDVEHENSIVFDNNCSNNNSLQKDNSVVRRLRKAINAPCVPFDRWAVDVIPLRVAQEYFVHDHIPFCNNNTGNHNNEKCGKENNRKKEQQEKTDCKHEQLKQKPKDDVERNSYNNTNDIIINYNNAQNEELEAILQADRENTHSAHYPSVVTVDDQYAVSVINKSALINSTNNKNKNIIKNIQEENNNIISNSNNENTTENVIEKANNEPHYRVLSEANVFLNKVPNENEHSAATSNLSHVNNINIIVDNNNSNISGCDDNRTVKETVNDTHPSTYTYTNTTINNKTLECSDNTIHNIVLQSKEHQELQTQKQEQEEKVICNENTNNVNNEINVDNNNGDYNILPVVNECEEHDWQNDPNVSAYISRVD